MPEALDLEFIQEMFPTLSEMTYLNNAATGIPPMTCINSMKEYLDNKIRAIGDFDETLDRLKQIRQLLAELLGGTRSQYGLIPNTTTGLNSFAHSIDYPEGSNIVLCDMEFPANYVPWQNVCRLYGTELRVVKSEEGTAHTEAYRELVDENTRVLAVSQVQFGSGFRSDLRELSRAIHDAGGYLVADIIQAAGWAETDLVKEGVDFATGQAAKWLLGPIGAGFVYVNEKIIDDLTPRYLGWWGVKGIHEFGYFEREPFPDAKKFQVGSPAMIAYVGFMESLKTISQIPGETREAVALEIADYLRKRLAEEEIEHYIFDAEHRSATVSCRPDDVQELNKNLAKEKIYCSVRGGRLRVSPHFYNTTEEIDRLLNHLG